MIFQGFSILICIVGIAERKCFCVDQICTRTWAKIYRANISLQRKGLFPAVNMMFAKWEEAISELLQDH